MSPSIEKTPSTAISLPPVGIGSFELALEVLEVVVLVLERLSETQARAIQKAGVVEAVEEHQIVAVEEAGKNAEVHLETGRERQDGLGLHEGRQPGFEFDMDVEGAVQKARSRATGAIAR